MSTPLQSYVLAENMPDLHTTNPISIGNGEYTATISLQSPADTAPVVDTPLTMLLLAGGLLLAFAGILILQVIQARRLRHLLTKLDVQAFNNASVGQELKVRQEVKSIQELVLNLCNKNHLMRLNAVHELARHASENPAEEARIAAILAAYIRAMTSDQTLRQAAQAEIQESLRTLSDILKQAKSTVSVYIGKANFSGMTLRNLHLVHTDFTGADFTGSIMENVNLQNSILCQANFSAANLQQVNMEDANKTGTIWSEARLDKVEGISESYISLSNKLLGHMKNRERQKLETDRTQAGKASSLFLTPEMAGIDKNKLH